MVEDPKTWKQVVERFARHAELGGGNLKLKYQDKFKAELMNSQQRWEHVSPEELRETCLAEGLKPADADRLAGFLRQRKTGHRFQVRSRFDRSYRYIAPPA